MRDALSRRICHRQVGSVHRITELEPRRSTASRVGSHREALLAICEVDGNGDRALSLHGKVNRVGHRQSAIGDDDGVASAEGQLLDRTSLNGSLTRRAVDG